MQTTSHILMIRPVSFGYNAETAVNNAFQVKGEQEDVQAKALKEFDGFVDLLRKNKVDVLVIEDTPTPYTPDSIFPNNWISFHGNGNVLLYPMFAENRRAERKEYVLDKITKRFMIKNRIDLSHYESDELFLEGTGSMVLDRDNRIAFACLSPRTSEKVLADFCEQMEYTAIVFDAIDGNDQPIYHTNVMMCVADEYIVICMDTIRSAQQSAQVQLAIEGSGKKSILISIEQMNHFAGNMLQVESVVGTKLLIMSSQAYESLTAEQVKELTAYNEIIHSPLSTIEKNGGGSARCMMAEIHLPER